MLLDAAQVLLLVYTEWLTVIYEAALSIHRLLWGTRLLKEEVVLYIEMNCFSLAIKLILTTMSFLIYQFINHLLYNKAEE